MKPTWNDNTTLNKKVETEIRSFNLVEETGKFLKLGKTLDNTTINKSINNLDYLLYAFVLGVVIIENIYFFIVFIGLILLFSIKYLKSLKEEFLNSGLITYKECMFSISSYLFFLTCSVFCKTYFSEVIVIFIGLLSTLLLKIYINRIAQKVYDNQN